MRYIVGIDPGQYGAICFYDLDAHTIEIHDMPIYDKIVNGKKRPAYDYKALSDIFEEKKNDIIVVYVEEISAMPHDGAIQAFKFGLGYGVILMGLACHEIPYETVRPAAWKKSLKVSADKTAARAKASTMMPKCSSAWKLVKHDGRAEASMIAIFALCARDYKIEKAITLA